MSAVRPAPPASTRGLSDPPGRQLSRGHTFGVHFVWSDDPYGFLVTVKEQSIAVGLRPTLFRSIQFLERNGDRAECDWEGHACRSLPLSRTFHLTQFAGSQVWEWAATYKNDGEEP